ncbi:transcriptional regulator, LysR family [gamma proteobacterium NOR5-3]|nr:transcriptional regulator, LysR family [gamma proteobacterium NOR5-3]
MHTPLNLRHLQAALAVQQQGSISRAKETVHLSQSAITQGISKLEKDLGFRLFDRSYEGLNSTKEGEIYLRRVAQSFNYLRQIDKFLPPTKHAKNTPIYRSLTSTQIRALMHVVEQRSYTRAARRLQLAQPSVYRAVQDVEAVFGYKFFNKSPSGLEPSWSVKEIARHIALFFAELSQAFDEVNEHKGQMAGRLRIGSLPLARTRTVPRAVVKITRDFPDVQVSIIDGPYEEQLHALLHGRLDLIVGALREPAPSPDIVQKILFEDVLHVVMRPGHPLGKRRKLSALELQNLDWVAPRQDTPAREAFTELFRSNGLAPPEHVIECSSLVATRGILMESDRAALLSARQVEVDLDSGLLSINPHHLRGTTRNIGITLRKGWEPTRVQQRFMDRLKEES